MKTIRLLLLTMFFILTSICSSYSYTIWCEQDGYHQGPPNTPCCSGGNDCSNGCANCPSGGCVCLTERNGTPWVNQICYDNAIIQGGTQSTGPTDVLPANLISPHGNIIHTTKIIDGVLHFATASYDGYQVYDETQTSITQVADYSDVGYQYLITVEFDDSNNVTATLWEIVDGVLPSDVPGFYGIQCQ